MNLHQLHQLIIPNQVQIETVAGMCSVSCNMCPIDRHPRSQIMTNSVFREIMKRFLSIQTNLEMITISGIGEPLLDKGVADKVAIAKELGFIGIAVYTNATPLTASTSAKLLASGLDTLVISLDGITKETQDVIRVGSDIKRVLKNIHKFLDLRNELAARTKVILRFTRQKINQSHFDEYKDYWQRHLNSDMGDAILCYDVHNHGALVDTTRLKIRTGSALVQKVVKCDELYRRFTVHSNGECGLCCGDHNEKYKIGSVLEISPIDLYNTGHHKNFRQKMMSGRFSELDICQSCSVMDSLHSKRSF